MLIWAWIFAVPFIAGVVSLATTGRSTGVPYAPPRLRRDGAFTT